MPPPGRGGGFKKGGFKKGAGGPRKSFGDRGERKSPGGFKKTWGEGGERKSFASGFKKSYDRPAGGFKKSYDRPEGGGGERKSYDRPAGGGFKKSYAGEGERKSFAPGGFKKSYDRPAGGGFKGHAGEGERRSFGPGGFKKSYDRPAGGGFKKDYAGEGERKSFAPGGFKKSYQRPEGGGFKKSWAGEGERKSFAPGGAGFKKSYGRPGADGAPGGFKKSFDRGAAGGDRPAFGRKPSRDFERPEPGEERIKRYDKPGGRREVPQSPRVPAAEAAGAVPPNDGRWVWGINPVLEALRAHPEQVERIYIVDGLLSSSAAAEILSRAREANLKVDSLERDRLTAMIGGGVHQGVVAEVREYQYKELEDLLELAQASGRPPLIVVLDGIQDPHNLGAIIRSAHSFGAHGVVVAKDRAAGVTGMVAKSSAGAIEHCPVARVTNIGRALEQLKEAGCWTVAADPEGDQPAWTAKLEGPLAIVVGSEGPGVREGVLGKCDFRVLIPMSGAVASLNASVSAGVLLYEVNRQRALGARPGQPAAPEPS